MSDDQDVIDDDDVDGNTVVGVEDDFDDDEDNFNKIDAADAGSDDSSDDDDDDAGDDEGSLAPSAVAVLEYLVQSVVDDPSAVAVEVDESGRRPALNVTVGDGDMGRVIGKRGRVAQSIRTVTRAAASRDNVEIDIEFLD